MIEKICLNCGKIYSVYRSQASTSKYCSKDCYVKHRFTKLESNCVCQHCGKKFHVRKSFIDKSGGKYCSLDCKVESQKKGIWKSCEMCGVKFYVSSANLHRGQDKYCSRKCYGESIRNKIEKPCIVCGKLFLARPDREEHQQCCSDECMRENRKTGEKRNCLNCGKEFYAIKCLVDAGIGNFCSSECMLENRKTGEKRNCLNCGNGYYVSKSHIDNGRGIFCSRKCHYEWVRMRSKDSRFTWRYKNWRQEVFERDNYTCQKCGQTGGELHAHHIKHWAHYINLRYEVTNGVTLCKNCHHGAHPFLRL